MRQKIIEMVDEVMANTALSDGEQGLEIATRIMHMIQIPQHQGDVGNICDMMTQLGVVLTSGRDPEKLAPEQLDEVIANGQTPGAE